MKNEASILHPDVVVTINGRKITIHEFTFVEGLELGPIVASLITDLDKDIGSGGNVARIFDTLFTHPETLKALLIKSTDVDEEWLNSLSGNDGDHLLMEFWGVNAPFFMRRLVSRRMIRDASLRLVKST